jgi:hypothetical protein
VVAIQYRSGKPELITVKVANIVEFPTELGNRCLLLQELGLNAYSNTEEELFDALTESAKNPEKLNICFKYSRCQKFWKAFKQGHTPFTEHEPIRLLEHKDQYWVMEGKHRTCLAKRAGVESLEAVIYHLKEATESLLPSEGNPDRFYFQCSIVGRKIHGTLAYLWVSTPPGSVSGKFDFHGAWLDTDINTGGEFLNVLSGVEYRTLIRKKQKRLHFFQFQEEFIIESEVLIKPNHTKTKVWLLEVPAAEVFGFDPPSFHTVYRRGCWRQSHMFRLSRIWPSFL